MTDGSLGNPYNVELDDRMEVSAGCRLSGFLRVENPGEYTITPEKVSQRIHVYIDNVLEIDCERKKEKSEKVTIRKGYVPFIVDYFHFDPGDPFELYIEGQGMSKQPIPGSMLVHSIRPIENATVQSINPEVSTESSMRIVKRGVSGMTITVPSAKEYILSIMRLDGRLIDTRTGVGPTVINTESFQDRYASGVYSLIVQSGKKTIRTKQLMLR